MLLPPEIKSKLLDHGSNVLFHGTRFLANILLHEELATSIIGDPAVHLTSCPEEAAAYATAGPRPFDDGRGAIIVLDRDRLEAGEGILLT